MSETVFSLYCGVKYQFFFAEKGLKNQNITVIPVYN